MDGSGFQVDAGQLDCQGILPKSPKLYHWSTAKLLPRKSFAHARQHHTGNNLLRVAIEGTHGEPTLGVNPAGNKGVGRGRLGNHPS